MTTFCQYNLNEFDDTNGFPFLMPKLYAWRNVDDPFTDSFPSPTVILLSTLLALLTFANSA